MKKALILYFSGSGSTRTITEVLTEKLSDKIEVETKEINLQFDYSSMENYDILVFGFPVFGCEPPKTYQDFINKMPEFENPIKGFSFATYALYQENCTRHFIESIASKNIIINDSVGIKGPASDGSLMFPESLKFIYRYEKLINKKLDKAISRIVEISESEENKIKIPPKRWYTTINRIALYFMEKEYEALKKKLKALPERCVNCKYCVNHCLRGCWTEGEEVPVFNHSDCELCLKCVHNCPKNAIIFADNMKDRPRLNAKFYAQKKQEILEN